MFYEFPRVRDTTLTSGCVKLQNSMLCHAKLFAVFNKIKMKAYLFNHFEINFLFLQLAGISVPEKVREGIFYHFLNLLILLAE